MNLVNEAALMAARRNKRMVTQVEFEDAKDKVMMGAERKSLVMTEEEKLLTAYHEGGHAIVAINVKATDPVHKATIIPRGRALGMVMQLPERDKLSMSLEQMTSRLAIMMGGRVAEELVFGHEKVTSGAASDIEQATKLARMMVTRWGLSDALGTVAYGENQEEVFLGYSVSRQQNHFGSDRAEDRWRNQPPGRGRLSGGAADPYREARRSGNAGQGPARIRDSLPATRSRICSWASGRTASPRSSRRRHAPRPCRPPAPAATGRAPEPGPWSRSRRPEGPAKRRFAMRSRFDRGLALGQRTGARSSEPPQRRLAGQAGGGVIDAGRLYCRRRVRPGHEFGAAAKPLAIAVSQSLPAPTGLRHRQTAVTAANPPSRAPSLTCRQTHHTPESRSAAELALSADPVFDEGTYQRIKEALLSYAAIQVRGGWPACRPTPSSRRGKADRTSRLLRRRLVITEDMPARARSRRCYDAALVDGVKRFQLRHGLDATGIVGPQTLRALNVPVAARIKQLEASLDRLLGMDFVFAERYVVVNIPAAFVEAVANDKVERRYRVIVGKIDKPSPTLTAFITAINLNPTWTVPLPSPRTRSSPHAQRSQLFEPHAHARAGRARRRDQSAIGQLVVRPFAELHRPAGFRQLECARLSQDRHAESVFGVHARHRYRICSTTTIASIRTAARGSTMSAISPPGFWKTCRVGIAPPSMPGSQTARRRSSTCRTGSRSPGSISPAG